MAVKHAFTNPKSDGADHTVTRPSDWNADHVVDASIVAVFDGGASAITGTPEVDVSVPFGGTITGWTLLADASGSAVIDIWKTSYANYAPGTHPVVGDSITASALPTLSSAVKATDSTLTGWTKTIAANDILRFHLNSSAVVKRLELTVTYTRS